LYILILDDMGDGFMKFLHIFD